MYKIGYLLFFLVAVCISSCTSINQEKNYAPVHEVALIEPIPQKGVHKVLPGETLYSIAWRYGLDYNDLAKQNRISPPYHIYVNQILYLNKNKPSVKVAQKKGRTHAVVASNTKTMSKQPPVIAHPRKIEKVEKEPSSSVKDWHWPANGPIIGKYSSLNKGINIAGQPGDPVFATAAGKVVYSGDGLRGYGNLLIIKHNRTFLTAYAHNNKILVKNGDWVKSGQQIAEMGNTDSKYIMLHFEIRRRGQPVNPLIYLNKKI
jgi:lipoprotein NlpD